MENSSATASSCARTIAGEHGWIEVTARRFCAVMQVIAVVPCNLQRGKSFQVRLDSRLATAIRLRRQSAPLANMFASIFSGFCDDFSEYPCVDIIPGERGRLDRDVWRPAKHTSRCRTRDAFRGTETVALPGITGNARASYSFTRLTNKWHYAPIASGIFCVVMTG